MDPSRALSTPLQSRFRRPVPAIRRETIVKRIAIFLLIAGAGMGIGFALAYGVIQLWGAVQGPFQPQWDDSWRERVPVALAYLLLGAGTLGGLAVAWRVSRSVR
ncbi:MAG: hypothetical protein ACR2KI_06880 [Candidatus Limnocylindria bacterium]